MKKAAISLRLDETQATQVADLAAKWQVTEATVIRWALTALHDYVRAHNGHVVLPLDFDQIWRIASTRATLHRPSDSLNEDPPPELRRKQNRAS